MVLMTLVVRTCESCIGFRTLILACMHFFGTLCTRHSVILGVEPAGLSWQLIR
uniref:Uncharacterized protein n=1 Tax=Anguilla anguilla TaxID=7936 RepID=A0A0E9QBZ4_ANGAN